VGSDLLIAFRVSKSRGSNGRGERVGLISDYVTRELRRPGGGRRENRDSQGMVREKLKKARKEERTGCEQDGGENRGNGRWFDTSNYWFKKGNLKAGRLRGESNGFSIGMIQNAKFGNGGARESVTTYDA